MADQDAYVAAVARANALLAAYGRALQAKDPASEALAGQYRGAMADVERLMPEEEKAKVAAWAAAVDRLVAYARAVERGDRAEMKRLYAAMSAEERTNVQHAHNDLDDDA
jgi:hypothetical protein